MFNKNVFISLGSNKGNRLFYLEYAKSLLYIDLNFRIINESSIYETEPMYNRAQKKFLNQVIEIETTLAPFLLLNHIKDLEMKIGRQMAVGKNMPREIDIDILSYGKMIVKKKKLTLPHKGFKERRFVLKPWAEIAENYKPIEGIETVRELLDNLIDSSDVVLYKKRMENYY
tara:strand:- start:639 stop:1154 length:516 start_codon:yes stop_codon:yes gene_type:complete